MQRTCQAFTGFTLALPGAYEVLEPRAPAAVSRVRKGASAGRGGDEMRTQRPNFDSA